MTTATSKILVIGVTGTLGFDLAMASIGAAHPTFGLVRDSAFPIRARRRSFGHSPTPASLFSSLADAIKQVDVVICSIPAKLALDQKPLIRAIKLAGGVKRFIPSEALFKLHDLSAISKSVPGILRRFIPSEFGLDPEKTRVSHLDNNFYARKIEIRHLVEAENIPYTYICCNFFMRFLLPSLVQPGLKSPPRDKVTIYGNGTVEGVFVNQRDIAAFTIAAVDDPRTLNKTLHLRPPGNVCSMNELVEIWESKIGNKLQKTYISEDEMLKNIKEPPYPENMEKVFIYCAFVNGDQTYFDIESSGGVEATQLYPEIKYTTISDYLDTLV